MMQSDELRSKLTRAASYAEAVDIVASHYAKLEGKSRWGKKVPVGVQHLRTILRAFPNAKIIYMVRDPRAVVCSFISSERNPAFNFQNVYNKAKYWAKCEQLADKFQKFSPQNMKQVKYEDLIAKPEAVVRNICSFIGVDFEKTMLDTASTAWQYAPKGADGHVMAAHKELLKSINASRVETWKEELLPRLVSLIEVVTRKWLARRGYTESFSAQPQVSAGRTIVLEIGWHIDKLRHIIHRSCLKVFWIARVLTERA